MYLEKLIAKDFRSFDEIEISLQGDLTILAGENNGGKSNAIDAMRLLTVPLGGRREIYCEPSDVRFGCGNTQFELEGHFSALSVEQQGLFISAAADASLQKAVFGLRYDAKKPAGSARPSLWAGQFKATPEPGCHERLRHVYLPPLRDAKRALASGNPTRIMALLNHFLEGAEPAAIVEALGRAGKHEVLERVDAAVGKGLEALTIGARPQVAALGFSSDETLIDIARDLRFKLADHGVSPEDLQYSGHGYANLLYMATIAVELEKVRTSDLTLFLVEEPEAHLHPQLQAAVLCFLQEQAENSRKAEPGKTGPAGELQVVVATHSPNLSAWVPSKNIVVFKSVTLAAPPAAAEPAAQEAQAEVPAAEVGYAVAPPPEAVVAAPPEPAPEPEAAEQEAPGAGAPMDQPLGAPPSRRVSRCIPLASLALEDEDRRKVDRYLDVTRASFLFGGRMFLVEGIAEALLLPVIAKKHVLKDDAEKFRIFRSVVFVPIDGVDFEPYAKLLLTQHSGVCIADRLVVMTDGDKVGTKEDEEDGEPEGDAAAEAAPAEGAMPAAPVEGEPAVAAPAIIPGERRKQSLVAVAKAHSGEARFEALVSTYSLETELVRAGNEALLRKVFLKLKPRSAAKWDTAIGKADEDEKAKEIQALFKNTRKGDFAQLLAWEIENGAAFTVPAYIRDAIASAVM